MRVAVVTTSYPSYPGDAAGHFVREEALQLAAQGEEVHVLAPTSQLDRTLDYGALQVWPISHAGAFGWPGAMSRLQGHPWRAAGAMAFVALARRQLQALRPDKVVAHWLVPSAYPIAVFGYRSAQLEAVAHGGDVRALVALPALLRDRIVCALVERDAQVRFVAHTLRDSLLSVLPGALARRLSECSYVRPASLGLPDVRERASELSKARTKPMLATAVGRAVASKRLHLAVEAAALLRDSVQLCVVGDGPELPRLRSLGVCGDVSFLGQVRREEALAWIAASDVLVHPSSQEAAPTVVREARSLGVPVVACAAGDLEQWALEDPMIKLVEPSAQGIAGAMREVCAARQ